MLSGLICGRSWVVLGNKKQTLTYGGDISLRLSGRRSVPRHYEVLSLKSTVSPCVVFIMPVSAFVYISTMLL
jgi:hypothetical protein